MIAEVIARQWWLGHNPEALRPENRERFDIDKKPLSSNMIALACSAVSVLPCSLDITSSFDTLDPGLP